MARPGWIDLPCPFCGCGCGIAKFTNMTINGDPVADFEIPFYFNTLSDGVLEGLAGSFGQITTGVILLPTSATDRGPYANQYIINELYLQRGDLRGLDTANCYARFEYCAPPPPGDPSFCPEYAIKVTRDVGLTYDFDFDDGTLAFHCHVFRGPCPIASACVCKGSTGGDPCADEGTSSFSFPNLFVTLALNCPSESFTYHVSILLQWFPDRQIWSTLYFSDGSTLFGDFPELSCKMTLMCDGTLTGSVYQNGTGGSVLCDFTTVIDTSGGCDSAGFSATCTAGVCIESGSSGAGVIGTIGSATGYCYSLQYVTLTASGGSPTETEAINGVAGLPIYLSQVGSSTIWTGTGAITFSPPFDNGHGATTTYDVDVTFDTSDDDLQVLITDPVGGSNVQISAITPSTSGPPTWTYTGSTFISSGLFGGSTITVPDGFITQC